MHFQTWPAWVLVLLLLNCLINHHMVQWEGYQAFRNGIPATADCSFQHHWVKSSCFNISGWYVWRSLHQVFAFFLVKQEPRGILDEVEEKNITMDLRMGDSIYVQEILFYFYSLEILSFECSSLSECSHSCLPNRKELSSKEFQMNLFQNCPVIAHLLFWTGCNNNFFHKRYYCPVWNVPPQDQMCHSTPSKPPSPSRALICPSRTKTTEKGAQNSPLNQSWREMKQKRPSPSFQINFVILTTHLRVVLHLKKLNLLLFENPPEHWMQALSIEFIIFVGTTTLKEWKGFM